MELITRNLQQECRQMALKYPVVTILGPRQSGKTTLVKELFPEKPYISLEDPDSTALAKEDPRGFLAMFKAGCISGFELVNFNNLAKVTNYFDSL